jgi:hypothetical protein
MELSHRFSQRTALLLRLFRLFRFNALEVYEEVIQLYEIRSTFIHSSLIKNQLRKPLDKLCGTIFEYSCVSVLIFIQLGKI